MRPQFFILAVSGFLLEPRTGPVGWRHLYRSVTFIGERFRGEAGTSDPPARRKGAPAIYTYEDKTGRSGRTIDHACPAPTSEELTTTAVELAKKSFECLGIHDCARVDMSLGRGGRFYVLEVNSLSSLGEHGSYLVGAAQVGLDFTAFVNRLVDIASTRYFGTPSPPVLDKQSVDNKSQVLSYVTQRRAQIEEDLRQWVDLSSRTGDTIGIRQALEKAGEIFDSLRMRLSPDLSDDPEVST